MLRPNHIHVTQQLHLQRLTLLLPYWANIKKTVSYYWNMFGEAIVGKSDAHIYVITNDFCKMLPICFSFTVSQVTECRLLISGFIIYQWIYHSETQLKHRPSDHVAWSFTMVEWLVRWRNPMEYPLTTNLSMP